MSIVAGRRLCAAALLVCWLASARVTAAAQGEDVASRPNILFIYADDQSYKTLSCYGAQPEWAHTPNIDQLARNGVRFERAYLGAWCMPSRASMLTGLLQHGVESMRMEGTYPGSAYDPKQCPFVPSQFRQQGYHTAQIGKWHTGVDTGWGRDWDYQIVWNRPGHPENAGNYFANQIVTFNGQDRQVGGYSTDNYTDWAIEYIEGAHRDPSKPWYLWLCYGAVHGPTTPAERHAGALSNKLAPVPQDILGPWPGKPEYLSKTAAWMTAANGRPAMKPKQVASSNFNVNDAGKPFDEWIQQMNECNMAVDEGVGRLMESLRSTGQLDNTLVIYSADQGYGLGEHGFNQKIAPYDATIASPLILSQPGRIPENRTCKHPVNSPDLVDFMCRWADVEIPWKTHGRDIRPIVNEPESTQWNAPVLLTHTARSYGSDTDVIPTDERLTIVGDVPWYVMLRDGKYKYIRNLVEGETEELYDLENDPEELTNLVAAAGQHARLISLRAKAVAELKRTDAGFVDSMPATMLP
ncbi:MAG: sulfatase-like hydrolase/transferase [Planctomycetales bacterium]|nr:sulfatase-like hydrolase/transferase [Planctomycetales bacterium]